MTTIATTAYSYKKALISVDKKIGNFISHAYCAKNGYNNRNSKKRLSEVLFKTDLTNCKNHMCSFNPDLAVFFFFIGSVFAMLGI